MSSFLSPDAAAALAALASLDAGSTAGDAGGRADVVPPLDRLRGIRSLVAALEADPASLVAARAAVEAGATWDDVAEAAGLSASAAKYRWAGDDDAIAERQEASRRRKRERPSSSPTDLPGESVSEAAKRLGVTPNAIYQRVNRGLVEARTVTLPDGRSYKRVFFEAEAEAGAEAD
ncbi:hypothetical protein [Agromyces aureus]|uniref:Uncharacterized protein n=1 Tax=Agromyces aureus TaxID=453304 RepID=A0A191WDX3_9MICO|nr:hypothetical protein [Agromyces aureus]ANJ26475.1 hypothetical protein ATC03_06800 [Agromyces aureus]